MCGSRTRLRAAIWRESPERNWRRECAVPTWSRFAVNTASGRAPDAADDPETIDPQHSDIMRAMQQMASQMASAPPVLSTLSITEATGQADSGIAPGATISDEVSQDRKKEGSRPDVLMQLQ